MKRYEKGVEFAICRLEDMETIDPVKHGKWIWEKDHWECSKCRGGRYHDLALGLDASYCGRCGARMDKD